MVAFEVVSGSVSATIWPIRRRENLCIDHDAVMRPGSYCRRFGYSTIPGAGDDSTYAISRQENGSRRKNEYGCHTMLICCSMAEENSAALSFTDLVDAEASRPRTAGDDAALPNK